MYTFCIFIFDVSYIYSCVYIYVFVDLVDIRPADDAGGDGRVPRGEGQDHGECGSYSRVDGMYILH